MVFTQIAFKAKSGNRRIIKYAIECKADKDNKDNKQCFKKGELTLLTLKNVQTWKLDTIPIRFTVCTG